MAVSVDALKNVPLMSGLDERGLNRLAAAFKERTVGAGEELVKQGSGGVAFFILLEGELAVRIGDEVRATLSPGDYTGEMSLLDPDALRSASIAATTDSRVAYMSSWEFKPFVLEHPEIAWEMLKVLAKRVREAEQRRAHAA